MSPLEADVGLSSTSDRVVGMDSLPNTSSKRKEGLDGVIYLFNRGSNSGGGSQAILNLGIWRLFKSFINGRISEDGIIHSITNLNGWVWVSIAQEYVNSYVEGIPKWLFYPYYSGITLFIIYRFLYKIIQFDFHWEIPPAMTIVKKPNNPGWRMDYRPMIEWFTPVSTCWYYNFHISSGYNRLKTISKSLGLRCILDITRFFVIEQAYVNSGLRYLLHGNIQTVLMRFVTRRFDLKLNTNLFYFFNILVYMGVGVVVWYQIIPSAVYPALPSGFDAELLPIFQNPTSIVEGYKRVSYLITKDITPTVISTFKNDILLRDILMIDVEQDTFSGVGPTHRKVCIGTAIMMAVFITTKTITV